MNSSGARVTRPVRLTLVVDARDFGGAEIYLLRLIRHLPARFHASVLATAPVPARLRDAIADLGAPLLVTTQVRSKFDLAGLARQTRAVRSTEPDIVHLNLAIAGSSRHLLAPLAAMRVPALATLHLVSRRPSRAHWAVVRPFFRRLSAVIAVSNETKELLRADLGVPEEMITVVANGVEVCEPVTPRDSRPIRIGSVGRLTPQKGFDLLIDASRGLARDGIAVEVAIAGDGPHRAELERQATGLPIHFEGYLLDVSSFLKGLDVFALPSRWEGRPFALLEAMMVGLPCVAADVGDVGTALGGAGVLIAPGRVDDLREALRTVVQSPERRRMLGAAAHTRAREHHSVTRMVDDTVRVYEEVLRG